jgi:homoserine O-acetyltransferase
MDRIMPVVAFPTKVSGSNLLWRRMVVKAIESDPDWNGGNYVDQPRSLAEGYGVLRFMIDGVAAIGKLKRVADVRFDHRWAQR